MEGGLVGVDVEEGGWEAGEGRGVVAVVVVVVVVGWRTEGLFPVGEELGEAVVLGRGFVGVVGWDEEGGGKEVKTLGLAPGEIGERSVGTGGGGRSVGAGVGAGGKSEGGPRGWRCIWAVGRGAWRARGFVPD